MIFSWRRPKQLEQQPQIRPPLLTGDDLIALGMKPGPALGALLAEIREKQLQDELKTQSRGAEVGKGANCQRIVAQASRPRAGVARLTAKPGRARRPVILAGGTPALLCQPEVVNSYCCFGSKVCYRKAS